MRQRHDAWYSGASDAVRDAMEKSRETKKQREVVRVLLSRSRNLFEISQSQAGNHTLEALKDLDLTRFIFIRKDKSSFNPDQVMPIGGKLEKGEDKVQAAARELFEETHLRAVGDIVEIGKMQYGLPGKRTEISAHFVGTKALPVDRPFVLNPKEDKIADFPELDLKQMAELFYKCKISEEDGEKVLLLLDSLHINPREDDSKDGAGIVAQTTAGEPDAKRVEQAKKLIVQIFNYAQDIEMNKKIDVIENFVEIIKDEPGDYYRQIYGDVLDLVKSEDLTQINPYRVNVLWGKMVDLLSKSCANLEGEERGKRDQELRNKLLSAVDYSNFCEEMIGGNEVSKGGYYHSQSEAVLRLAYTLLETGFVDERYLTMAKRNPYLSGFVTRLLMFFKDLTNSDEKTSKQLESVVDMLEQTTASRKKDASIRAKIETAFCKAFKINQENLRIYLNAVDDMLKELAERALNPKFFNDVEYDSKVLQQDSEVQGASLATLLNFALPDKKYSARGFKTRYHRSDLDKYKNAEKIKSVVFEARRKLVLAIMLADTVDYYNRLKGRSGNPIQENVYDNILSGPVYSFNRSDVFDENGNLVDIKVIKASGFQQRREPNSDDVRRIPIDSNQPGYFVYNDDGGVKSLPSVMRKMLVRGYDRPEKIDDHFRRSLVVYGSTDPNLKTSDILVPETKSFPNVAPRGNGYGVAIVDHKAVVDIIEKIAQQPGVVIRGFVPTPRAGEKIKSIGVGGGGNVRYAKFYLQYIPALANGKKITELTKDDYRESSIEEVQVYVPDEQGRSAEWYKKQKEEDDERYFFKRLFASRGRNSLIDLLYPTKIFGEPVLRISGKVHRGEIGNGRNGNGRNANGKK